MIRNNEDGYIMGFALAILLALSLTATGLMAIAGNELRSVRAAERDEHERLILHAAAVLGGEILATEPDRRIVAFQDGRARIQIGDRPTLLSVSWESDRIDVNTAPIEAISAGLETWRAPAADRIRIIDAIQMRRSRGQYIRSLDAVLAGVSDSECVRRALTVHGGRTASPDGPIRSELGRPGAGSRLRILAEIDEDGPFRAYDYVILVTGNPAEPAQIVDLRPVRQRANTECLG